MPSSFRTQRLSPVLAILPLALATALCIQDAQASGFQLKENSVQGLGRAYAGASAAPGDCAVVVNNPAAMVDLPANCAQVDLNIINFETHFHGSGTDALGAPLTGNNGGDGGLTKPVPATYGTFRLNDDVTLGLSINAPYGFQTEYKDGWIGRYEALLSKLESIDLTGSIGWRLNDQFSIGGSVIVQRTAAELTQAIDFGTILMAPTNGALLPQEADGFGGLKGNDWGYGFILGALWKPTPNDRFGIRYHSEIDHVIDGNGTFLVPSNLVPLLNGAFTNSSGKADFTTPWFASVSWWHDFNDRFSLGADVSFTHWSSFKELRVNYANPAQPDSVSEFDWKNTWFYSIGGDYRLDERWTLRAGIAFDETPTHVGTRTPRVPDNDRKWLSLGVGYRYSDALRFDAGYTRIWVDKAEINHTTPTFSTLVGHSDGKGNVLGIAAQYQF